MINQLETELARLSGIVGDVAQMTAGDCQILIDWLERRKARLQLVVEMRGREEVSSPEGEAAPVRRGKVTDEQILEAMTRAGGNKAVTARFLGVAWATVNYRMKKINRSREAANYG